jgi:AGCS family alanine or glycine:cation symporter
MLSISSTLAEWAWGPWLLILLLGGGFYFLARSRFLPYRHLGHAFVLLSGKYDNPEDPGYINHRKALSTALAGTIGMGNIAGVALAIQIGGPGAIFWMWMTALLGMATKFFTCSLAVMYRGRDSNGDLQGGPMYVIREALPKKWRFLAYMFAIVGMIGSLPALQTNQLVQALRDLLFIEQGWLAPDADATAINLGLGVGIAVITSFVMFGGLLRITRITEALVPIMSVFYVGGALVAISLNIDAVPAVFALIITDAFTGEAAAGGSLLAMILYGVRRGAVSNEAGMGTESLAHGAAKTKEPIREGMVAMLGPVFDTLLICTATAVVILLAGNSQDGSQGVTLTAQAFAMLLGPTGAFIVLVCIVCFATSTILTYSFYGSQCSSFVFGAGSKIKYHMVYVGFIVVASVLSLDNAVNLIDTCFALMAIPTMTSALWLAPKVTEQARLYWQKLSETQ